MVICNQNKVPVIDNDRRQRKKFQLFIMVICKENKIRVVDNLLLVNKKHSDHLYWYSVTKIQFPS